MSYNKLYEVLKPFNITETFLKENIKKLIDLKHSQLVKIFSEYDMPVSFAEHILADTKLVDELLTKGV
jgi:serine/threonine-protein kinase HipA